MEPSALLQRGTRSSSGMSEISTKGWEDSLVGNLFALMSPLKEHSKGEAEGFRLRFSDWCLKECMPIITSPVYLP